MKTSEFLPSFQPLLWEYVWCISILVTFFALAAIKKNRIQTMRRFMYLITVFGFGPIVYGAVYYLRDVWTYIETGSTDEIIVWQVRLKIPFFHLLLNVSLICIR